MYLAVNISRHIAAFDNVLLLTDSCMIRKILKYTDIPLHLLMRLHGPQIRSLLLFWQPIISSTLLSASTGPYLKQQQVGYAQILPIFMTDNPNLVITFYPLSCFTG